MYVRNFNELINQGDKELRKDLVGAIEAALQRVDPYQITRKLVTVNGNKLLIGKLEFDLKTLQNIKVIGAGKATYPIAKALEEILGDRISGLIIVREDEGRELSKLEVVRAGHPMPDERGFRAARNIGEIVTHSSLNDLYLVAFTGGCSALMPYPADGISLEEKRKVTELPTGKRCHYPRNQRS